METLLDDLQILTAYMTDRPRLAALAGLVIILVVYWLLDRLLGLFAARVPVDARQQAWLALAAPFFEVHAFRAGDLVGKRPLGRSWIKLLLRTEWRIRDYATATAVLEQLLQQGLRSDPRFQRPEQPPADQQQVDRALLAWDLTRVVFVARCCFVAGHLDEASTWHYVQQAAHQAGRAFASWSDWGNAFVDGRMLGGGGPNSYHETVVERLLADPDSIWGRVPWELAARI
jgi:hypothetical protein